MGGSAEERVVKTGIKDSLSGYNVNEIIYSENTGVSEKKYLLTFVSTRKICEV